jgi:hypothetical protein
LVFATKPDGYIQNLSTLFVYVAFYIVFEYQRRLRTHQPNKELSVRFCEEHRFQGRSTIPTLSVFDAIDLLHLHQAREISWTIEFDLIPASIYIITGSVCSPASNFFEAINRQLFRTNPAISSRANNILLII